MLTYPSKYLSLSAPWNEMVSCTWRNRPIDFFISGEQMVAPQKLFMTNTLTKQHQWMVPQNVLFCSSGKRHDLLRFYLAHELLKYISLIYKALNFTIFLFIYFQFYWGIIDLQIVRYLKGTSWCLDMYVCHERTPSPSS